MSDLTPPNPTDLTDYEVTIPMHHGPHTREFTLRVPCLSESFAIGAGAAIGLAVNEASGWIWKLGSASNHKATETVRPVGPRTIKDPAADQWSADLCTVPGLSVVVDEAGCIVLRYPGGSTTISDVNHFVSTIIDALYVRDRREAGDLT